MALVDFFSRNDFYATWQEGFVWATVCVVVVGACIGSFLNVVILRLPEGEDIFLKPSHCPKCDKKLRWRDNLPLVGWLLLRGRCRWCKAPISPRYIVIEALTAFLFLAVWLRAWHLWERTPDNAWPLILLICHLVLVAALIAIAVIDLEHFLVPDGIVLPVIVFGVVVALVLPASHELTSAPGHVGALAHKMVLMGATAVVAQWWEGILQSPRLLALFDVVLGIVIGGGFLWLLSEVGKLLRGRKHITVDEPGLVELTAEGYTTPADEFMAWDDTFIRARDRLVVEGVIEELKLRTKPQRAPAADDCEREVVVGEDGLELGDQVIALADIKRVTIRSREWVIPLEPMGFGDATLMAMVGSILGPGGVIFTLVLGSFTGTLAGGLRMLLARSKSYTPIPFGPALAVGALDRKSTRLNSSHYS